MPFHVDQAYAREYLEHLGLTEQEQTWCLENGRLSHVARSLIRIAQGEERDIIAIYNEERIKDGEYPISSDLIESIFSTSDEVVSYLS